MTGQAPARPAAGPDATTGDVLDVDGVSVRIAGRDILRDVRFTIGHFECVDE